MVCDLHKLIERLNISQDPKDGALIPYPRVTKIVGAGDRLCQSKDAITRTMKYYGITLGHYAWGNYSEHYFVSEDGEHFLEIKEPLSKENVENCPDFFASSRNKLTFSKHYLNRWGREDKRNVWREYSENGA